MLSNKNLNFISIGVNGAMSSCHDPPVTDYSSSTPNRGAPFCRNYPYLPGKFIDKSLFTSDNLCGSISYTTSACVTSCRSWSRSRGRGGSRSRYFTCAFFIPHFTSSTSTPTVVCHLCNPFQLFGHPSINSRVVSLCTSITPGHNTNQLIEVWVGGDKRTTRITLACILPTSRNIGTHHLVGD